MVILSVKKPVLPRLTLSTPTTFQPISAQCTLLVHATLLPVLTKTTMTTDDDDDDNNVDNEGDDDGNDIGENKLITQDDYF